MSYDLFISFFYQDFFIYSYHKHQLITNEQIMHAMKGETARRRYCVLSINLSLRCELLYEVRFVILII